VYNFFRYTFLFFNPDLLIYFYSSYLSSTSLALAFNNFLKCFRHTSLALVLGYLSVICVLNLALFQIFVLEFLFSNFSTPVLISASSICFQFLWFRLRFSFFHVDIIFVFTTLGSFSENLLAFFVNLFNSPCMTLATTTISATTVIAMTPYSDMLILARNEHYQFPMTAPFQLINIFTSVYFRVVTDLGTDTALPHPNKKLLSIFASYSSLVLQIPSLVIVFLNSCFIGYCITTFLNKA